MKNKFSWASVESDNPIQNMVEYAKILRDRPTTEVLVFPDCVANKLKNLENIWKAGQKK